MRIAFIGLGVMGYPMAGHLARAEHDVVVFNRRGAKARSWCGEYPGAMADSPRAAATGAEIVFSCVGNDDDVREVLLGDDGAVHDLSVNTVVVDHTTASPRLAKELDTIFREKSAGFIDAPVSGGQAGAENGQLTVMIGGDAESYEKALPLIECYAKAVTRIGPAGSGQLAKMVNQICIAGVVQGLAEGLHFAKRAGLEIAPVIESISQGAAQSWQMDNRWESMINDEFEFGFAVDWMRKDLAIALSEARENGARLELTEMVDRFYAEIQRIGGQRWDTSSLIARLD